jgi:hypothetical protein
MCYTTVDNIIMHSPSWHHALLPWIIFCGNRPNCHIKYIMTVDSTARYSRSWQPIISLQTISQGNWLNCCTKCFMAVDHVAMHKGFEVLDYIVTQNFVAIISLATKKSWRDDVSMN